MSTERRPEAPLRLEQHPFTEGLAPEFLRELSGHTRERRFETEEAIVREGDPAEEFFLVFEGKVALEVVVPDRPRRTIQTIGPGEVLGWSWLIPPRRWRLDARAMKRTRVLSVEAEALRRAMEERPADGYRFLLRLLPVITRRLEMTRIQLLDIHGS